ncbi:hypothetical protein F4779DRAFT_563948 [Xylariaceae sp. FL0662B]|nr:hypothetical protein F4779DRAFT_563948 [Xylariaceae sp. FL0662B]
MPGAKAMREVRDSSSCRYPFIRLYLMHETMLLACIGPIRIVLIGGCRGAWDSVTTKHSLASGMGYGDQVVCIRARDTYEYFSIYIPTICIISVAIHPSAGWRKKTLDGVDNVAELGILRAWENMMRGGWKLKAWAGTE